MSYQTLSLGLLGTNAYVLTKDNTHLIIDPGDEPERLSQELSGDVAAIILTHAHWDHIGAVQPMLEQHESIPLYVHAHEESWLFDAAKNGSAKMGVPEVSIREGAPIHTLKQGKLSIGPFDFLVLETPGHSPGSCSFYWEEENVVFAGDALFKGSVGRTDLYGGNGEQLLQSIQQQLLTLPKQTVVAPGHGPQTTIEEEMTTNPFL
ncbi:MBL fold metallo-hydrolase [Bacillaceae bacterium SIJ1]|uniref:MBL fold metallo-hydrolase n=1 Tax=Litoribacterium kuwaitense TaxID=1398745 RepID=UPI0013EC416F|nr:MBL fold metallo-hydrolase [Litoribacterium kuwaitense]NGP43571.1 MBL fold metallo-hydrolase [Litoribacterium kuwaitense]